MSNVIQLIVGLGNPGKKYEGSRHNAGMLFVEVLAKQHHLSLRQEAKFFGLIGSITLNGQTIRLLIPTTFMNRSGLSVTAVMNFYKIVPDSVLVVHDDLDIEPGLARFKKNGGHGGHNGLRDIIEKLGNNRAFYRLRIGIGHPGTADKVLGHVLGNVHPSDDQKIRSAIDDALHALPDAVRGHWSQAMHDLHTAK